MRGCSMPKWRQVWMAYQIISMRCCKVGRGITAASEKNSNLSYVGICITARWVRILPLGNRPFSLSRIACNKLSVLIMPFIKISAPPSRTTRTASRAASSGSSICTVRTYWGYFFNVGYFSRIAESPIIRNSAIPSSRERAMAYSVLGSLAQTTAIRFLLFKDFKCEVS